MKCISVPPGDLLNTELTLLICTSLRGMLVHLRFQLSDVVHSHVGAGSLVLSPRQDLLGDCAAPPPDVRDAEDSHLRALEQRLPIVPARVHRAVVVQLASDILFDSTSHAAGRTAHSVLFFSLVFWRNVDQTSLVHLDSAAPLGS